MNKLRIQALLLDIDGTLVDSVPYLRSVYNEFLERFGRRGSEAEFKSLYGFGIAEIVSNLKAKHHLSPPYNVLLKNYLSRMRALYLFKVRPMRGAQALLEKSHMAGIKIAFVTSAKREVVLPFLRKQNWMCFKPALISGSLVSRQKPHPEIYAKALSALNVKPGEAMAVEDSASGVRAAVLNHVPTLGFTAYQNRFTDSRAKLKKAGAFTVIQSLSEIRRFIDFSSPKKSMRPFKIITPRVLKVTCVSESLKLTPKIQKQINSIWVRARTKRGQHLYDGKIFSFIRCDHETVWGKFVAFRNYFAQCQSKKLKSVLQIKPVGVSGMVYWSEGREKKYLWAQRVQNVSHYAGFWELVPSGNLDSRVLRRDGTLDFKSQIKHEFQEETGMALSNIRAVNASCFVLDTRRDIYDICCKIRISPKGLDKLKLNEYKESIWLTASQMKKFIAVHQKKIVPTSIAFLTQQNLLKKNRAYI